MSERQITLSALVGRKVRDADGEVVGRVKELTAEIALDEGSEYVVREFRVGSHTVPWELLDLRDPANPRLRVSVTELQCGANDAAHAAISTST